jgi:hypothetical protein
LEAEFTVDLRDRIEGEEAEALWADYDASYSGYNSKSPCRQSFRKDDFLRVLADRSFWKLLVSQGGEILGAGICTFDLAKLPWISVEFFACRFPEHAGRILYLAGMFVSPGSRGLKAARPLMLGIRRILREHGGSLVGFDHSLKLQPWLPEVVMRATGGVPVSTEFEGGTLDHQVYQLLMEGAAAKGVDALDG